MGFVTVYERSNMPTGTIINESIAHKENIYNKVMRKNYTIMCKYGNIWKPMRLGIEKSNLEVTSPTTSNMN